MFMKIKRRLILFIFCPFFSWVLVISCLCILGYLAVCAYAIEDFCVAHLGRVVDSEVGTTIGVFVQVSVFGRGNH